MATPDRKKYGTPLRTFKADQDVTYSMQEHSTAKKPGKPHLDFRLGTPKTGLLSWAIPSAAMPKPGSRAFAAQSTLHDFDYGRFKGNLRERVGSKAGYGKGSVDLKGYGNAKIRRVTANAIHFTLRDDPTRYVLIKMTGPKSGKRDWLIMSGKSKPERLTTSGADDKEKSTASEQPVKTASDNTVPLEIIGESGGPRAEISVEIADTLSKRATGLSGRTYLPEAHGMFFDKVGAYWMKGVHVPLDIAFIDKQGEILEIKHMSTGSRSIYRPSSEKAAHAIETASGWFNKAGVATGARIKVKVDNEA